MKIRSIVTGILFFLAGIQAATAQNVDPKRLAAAEVWYAAFPVEEMVESALRVMADAQPEATRQKFYDLAYEEIDYDIIRKATLASSSRLFTAEEMRAMTAFYGTPMGKSISLKLGVYLTEVVPVVQLQLFRATQEAMEKIK